MIKLSVDTALITGAVITKSVVRVRVPAALTLPATSVCVADSKVDALALNSPATTAIRQLPLSSTTAVLPAAKVAPVTVTVEPASPVPVKLKPAAASSALIKLSADTTLINGAAGVTVSTSCIACIATVLTLPAASVAEPDATSTVIGVTLLALGVTTNV